MLRTFENFRDSLIIKLQNINLDSQPLQKQVKNALTIQNHFIMLSYLCEDKKYSFVYIITILARPQLLFSYYYICCFIFALLILFILSVFINRMPERRRLLWIGQLLRVNLYNFFFEMSIGQLQFVVHCTLIIIRTIDILFIQGTLNIRQMNFTFIFITYFQLAKHLINNILLILKIYFQYDIKFLCLIYSCIAILDQVIYSPIKCLFLQPFIIYAHLMTVFFSILHFANIKLPEFSILIICILILKIVIVWNRIQQKFPISNLDVLLLRIGDNPITFQFVKIIKDKHLIVKDYEKIIYATIKMRQKHHYEALCFLSQNKNLNWLLKIKKQVIITECLQQLEFKIKNSSKFDQSVALAVEQLMKSEDRSFLIQEKILQIIKQKQQMLKQIIEKDSKIYKKIIVFVSKVQKLKKKLEKQYSQFPNQKTLAILSFLYAEILNDYISANKLSFQSSKQELQKFQHHQTIFNMFNSKMIYFITDFDQQKLLVKRMSSNTSQLLNMRHDQLINKEIDQLLPIGIREHHNEMIIQFLEEGISKYMRKVDLKYFKSHATPFLITADFTLDISFTNSSLKFVTFLQPVLNQPMIIILNQHKIITEFSENLIETLNEKPENLIHKHMNQYLPAIDQIEYSQILENVEMLTQQSSYSTAKSYTIITTVNVKIKEASKRILYYLLTFQYIKKINQNSTYNQMFQSFSGQSHEKSDIKTTTDIKIHIDDDRISDILKEDVTVMKPYIMDDQNQRHQAYSTYFQFQQFSHKYLQIHGEKQKRSLPQAQSLQTKSQINTTLISPNNSQFYDHLLAQQQYYSRNSKKQLSYVKEECSIDMKEILKLEDESKLDELGKNSQVSTVYNLKQSNFYKKYELIHNVNKKACNHMSCLFLKSALVSLIFHSVLIYIIIYSLNLSLNQLVQDINLLQIKNQAFQPLESFWVNRWIIFNYMKMKQNGTLNNTEYEQLLDFPESTIPLQFEQLLTNLQSILNNEHLQSYLQNQEFTIIQYLDTNSGEKYNVSLRSSLNILVEAQFTLKQIYLQKDQPATDSPYMYYSYKNIYYLKQRFQDYNDEIYDQTILNSFSIVSIQRVLFLIEVIMIFGSSVILTILMKQSEKQHIKRLKLLFTCPKESYDLEILNYQQLIKFILKDSDNLFKYKFCISQKENQLINYRFHFNKYHKDYQSIKKSVKNLKVNVTDSVTRIILISIALLILGQGTYIYFIMSQYMNAYSPTALFFRQLSEVGTDIPTLYSHSSVLYGISNFTFYDQNDKNQLYLDINEALQRLEKFINIQIDQNNVLANNFMNEYNSLQTSNLCETVINQLFQNYSLICCQSLNQNLQRGISSALVYILNSMKTERDLNYFTERIGTEKYELEGALMFSDFIEKLNTLFYDDLIDVTVSQLNSLIYTVLGILFVLVFMMIIVVTFGKKYFSNKNDIISKSIFLIPFSVIFYNDYYELKIKSAQKKAIHKSLPYF